jgi:peroxiredoxin
VRHHYLAVWVGWLLASSALAQEPAVLNTPAPELEGITSWINSKPLKIADLKGQVVVLHFWTHGCINCIHNYPHMKSWHDRYGDKGVTVLGVHTPELPAEKSLKRIEKKVKDNKLAFAIAVDNDAETWKAWNNQFWPCIYLIDRTGTVRYGWQGELNQRGVKGEEVMRKKIAELLAEKP